MPQNFTEDDCPECPEEGVPPYFSTFADMMTLLFAFFVLMFSMSTLDPVKMAQMSEAMTDLTSGAKDSSEFKEPRLSSSQVKAELNKIKENLEESISEKVTISSDVNGVALEMDGDICFAQGTVNLHEDLMNILDIAAETVMKNASDMRPIFIQGHSDNVPVPFPLSKKYPTNWELSSARAAVVVNYLIKSHGINSSRLRAMGFADIWPSGIGFMDMRKPGYVDDAMIADKNSTSEKKAKNRRIKIIFTPS